MVSSNRIVQKLGTSVVFLNSLLKESEALRVKQTDDCKTNDQPSRSQNENVWDERMQQLAQMNNLKPGCLLRLTGDLRDMYSSNYSHNGEKTVNAQYPYALVKAVIKSGPRNIRVELGSSDVNGSAKTKENLKNERRDAEETIWIDKEYLMKYFDHVSTLAERIELWEEEHKTQTIQKTEDQKQKKKVEEQEEERRKKVEEQEEERRKKAKELEEESRKKVEEQEEESRKKVEEQEEERRKKAKELEVRNEKEIVERREETSMYCQTPLVTEEIARRRAEQGKKIDRIEETLKFKVRGLTQEEGKKKEQEDQYYFNGMQKEIFGKIREDKRNKEEQFRRIKIQQQEQNEQQEQKEDNFQDRQKQIHESQQSKWDVRSKGMKRVDSKEITRKLKRRHYDDRSWQQLEILQKQTPQSYDEKIQERILKEQTKTSNFEEEMRILEKETSSEFRRSFESYLCAFTSYFNNLTYSVGDRVQAKSGFEPTILATQKIQNYHRQLQRSFRRCDRPHHKATIQQIYWNGDEGEYQYKINFDTELITWDNEQLDIKHLLCFVVKEKYIRRQEYFDLLDQERDLQVSLEKLQNERKGLERQEDDLKEDEDFKEDQ